MGGAIILSLYPIKNLHLKNQTNYAFLFWLRKIKYKYILILVLINRSNINKERLINMVVMDLKLDNLCTFRNFHVNFSYPKKIVNSYIEHEHLMGCLIFAIRK